MNRKKMERHFMRLAWVTALNLSKDPKTKVGAIITTPSTRQISVGYNGFPAGLPEKKAHWERPHKYERVIHAEMNAILNCPFDAKGCIIYCTHQPCHRCMGAIVNAGITTVIYDKKYETMSAGDLSVWNEIKKLLTVRRLRDPFVDKLIEAYNG